MKSLRWFSFAYVMSALLNAPAYAGGMIAAGKNHVAPQAAATPGSKISNPKNLNQMDKAYDRAISAFKAGDRVTAAKWSGIAAVLGHAAGQHALATMFATGQGVDLDYEKAMKWWHLATAQGEVRSIYNLGVMYSHGRGVAVDNVEAYKWLHVATEQGFEDAYQLQPRLAEVMTLGQIAVSQARARAWVANHKSQ